MPKIWAYFLFKGHKNGKMFFFYKKYALIELQKQKGAIRN